MKMAIKFSELTQVTTNCMQSLFSLSRKPAILSTIHFLQCYPNSNGPFLSSVHNHISIRHHTTRARIKARFYYRFPFLKGYKSDENKKKIVILGTGWASMHYLKYLDSTIFDIIVISPRNYFTFTPLLPSVAAGTLSPLSAIEPVRNFTRHGDTVQSSLYEAVAKDIDFDKQEVFCISEAGDEFKVAYDYLVVGIGSDTNTFGIQGVEKYALFLKEVEHATRLRKTVSRNRTRIVVSSGREGVLYPPITVPSVMNNFERASLPSTSDHEKARLLHFIAVGGGPTGVETMAELSDFVKEDMAKHFPSLMQYVRLTLVEMTNNVLPMFSHRVSQFTIRTLLRHQKINVLLNHAVTRVRQKSIEIESREPGKPRTVQNISYGVCLWAVGVGNTALGKKLLTQIPEQQGYRVLKTDHQLRLIGLKNVYAIGDCKQVHPPQLKDHADYFIQLNGGSATSSEWFRKRQHELSKTFPQISKQKWNFWKNPLRQTMNIEQLKEYLETIDKNYKSPLPTAQNARQEGLYLACLFNEFGNDDENRAECGCAFIEKWWGAIAYIGHGRAVASFPQGWDILGGFYSFPLWKTVYLLMQLSIRSRFVVSFDWFKVWACGRDVGRDHVYIPGELITIKQKPGDEEDETEIIISQPLQRALSPKLLDMA